MKAKDIMACGVVTARPVATVKTTARLPAQHRISGMPVVGDGVLARIITRANKIRMLAGEK